MWCTLNLPEPQMQKSSAFALARRYKRAQQKKAKLIGNNSTCFYRFESDKEVSCLNPRRAPRVSDRQVCECARAQTLIANSGTLMSWWISHSMTRCFEATRVKSHPRHHKRSRRTSITADAGSNRKRAGIAE